MKRAVSILCLLVWSLTLNAAVGKAETLPTTVPAEETPADTQAPVQDIEEQQVPLSAISIEDRFLALQRELDREKKALLKTIKKKGYINKDKISVRKSPKKKSGKVATLKLNKKIKYKKYNKTWAVIKFNKNKLGFVPKKYISKKPVFTNDPPKGKNHITKAGGVYMGPSGKETYYNLPMQGVVRIMREAGYKKEKYWVRSDGAKMFGKYIMVAMDQKKHPLGSIVKISLGWGIVCDTGTFVHDGSGVKVDIAVTW